MEFESSFGFFVVSVFIVKKNSRAKTRGVLEGFMI